MSVTPQLLPSSKGPAINTRGRATSVPKCFPGCPRHGLMCVRCDDSSYAHVARATSIAAATAAGNANTDLIDDAAYTSSYAVASPGRHHHRCRCCRRSSVQESQSARTIAVAGTRAVVVGADTAVAGDARTDAVEGEFRACIDARTTATAVAPATNATAIFTAAGR